MLGPLGNDGGVVCPPEDAGNSNPHRKFRYTDGQYVFNLSTKGFAKGTW